MVVFVGTYGWYV